jgi:asparagine synthase (glutamine-hydrolysing)
MCGLAGYFGKNRPSIDLERDLLNMGKVIEHRGPDDSGIWHTKNVYSIGLVHRRLSILDLSKAGHQPMTSSSKRYVVSYNGEIYNHLELRQLIDKKTDSRHKWRGYSDTETLLACVEVFGVEDTLNRIVGMFAFALWDCKCNSLILARDRMGEKPLYYGLQNDTLLFGSDLKSLKQHPDFQGEINRDAIALLMRYGYIPAPSSIYTGIHKLPPGSYIKFESPRSSTEPKYYWKLSSVISNSNFKNYPHGYKYAVQKLDTLLGDSVEGQMMSDVPVGTFLSGGVDSTTITALAQSRSSSQIKTFTIGFDEELYNEAQHAKKIAKYLGTDHTELYVTPKDALNVIQKIPKIYTEPFADPSQIPTFLVSEMTKSHVTVGLSGDAGDEIFAGYNRYTLTDQYWSKLNSVPYSMRRFMSRGIEKFSPDQLNKLFLHVQKLLPAKYQQANIGEKLHKASIALKAQTSDELYRSIVSRWQNPEELVIGTNQHQTLVSHLIHPDENDIIHKMMEIDTMTYLPDDILCKVDRASMFVGLESRSPFLDHRIVEFAWGLPLEYKIKNGIGKSILRDVLHKYIPKELMNRPKMGFGVPISDWLRGPLKEWANDLLNEDRLRAEGFFYVDAVREKWLEHQLGVRNWQYQLWPILMFQLWLEGER